MLNRLMFFILFLSIAAQAQVTPPSTTANAVTAPPTGAVAKKAAAIANAGARIATKDRSIARTSLVFDYNSWFENINIRAGTPYQTKALLYGMGLSYEYNLLYTKWGWGLGGGIVHGFGVSGDASDSTSYYVKRVPLEIFRGSARYFKRVTARFDAGLLTTALYNLTSWPSSNGLSVEKTSSLMLGIFIDTRWRLDRSWDLVQAVGTFNRGPSLAWRLGTNYNF